MSTVAHEANSAPADFDRTTFFAGTCWHQRWEVFPGIFTPGHNLVAELCRDVLLPADLSGRRVLDIGAWNGCFSFSPSVLSAFSSGGPSSPLSASQNLTVNGIRRSRRQMPWSLPRTSGLWLVTRNNLCVGEKPQ